MTKPSPWTGVPVPYQNTLVTSGTYTVVNAMVPTGYLTLSRNGVTPLTFNFYDGGFASGLTIASTAQGGDAVFNVIGSSVGVHRFADSSLMRDTLGSLDLNVIGNTTYFHYGEMHTAPMIGNSTLNISLSGGTGANPYPNFANYGLIAADHTPYAPTAESVVNVTLGANALFSNYATMEADGAGTLLDVWSAPPNSPNGIPTKPFLTSFNNSALIVVNGGGMAQFTAPIVGTGTIEVDTGGRVKLNGPVSAGQTIAITAGTLEFGSKGSITNPSMQFAGKISGENAADTILLDGSYGVRDTFSVLSATGTGLAELRVFDPYNTQVADLRLVGHFQAADFNLTPHFGSSPTNNWTAVTFSNHANTPGVAHS